MAEEDAADKATYEIKVCIHFELIFRIIICMHSFYCRRRRRVGSFDFTLSVFLSNTHTYTHTHLAFCPIKQNLN